MMNLTCKVHLEVKVVLLHAQGIILSTVYPCLSSNNHLLSHRTWTCDIPTCTSSAHFTRLADLQRHQSTVHGVGTPEFPCYVARCNRVGEKGFTRRDHLVEHLRNFHHIDIPRRKPGERSAFPFGWPEGGGGSNSGGGAGQ